MNEEQSNPTPEPQEAADTPQTPAEPVETGDAASASDPHTHEIDLNPLFPGEDKDLNALFPDQEMKQFLKSLSRNKKDLSALNERFIQENQRDETPEESI